MSFYILRGNLLVKNKAYVNKHDCVACGSCVRVCPMGAIAVDGIAANINCEKCVGCGRCAKECPASVIQLKEG